MRFVCRFGWMFELMEWIFWDNWRETSKDPFFLQKYLGMQMFELVLLLTANCAKRPERHDLSSSTSLVEGLTAYCLLPNESFFSW